MVTTTRFPTASSGSNPPWTVMSNAYTDDGSPGTWALHDTGNSSAWGVWKGFDFSTLVGPIQGIQIVSKCGLGKLANGDQEVMINGFPPDNRQRLQFALTKDGVNPAGTIWTVDQDGDNPQVYAIGDSTNLHGADWTTLSDIKGNANFGVLVREPYGSIIDNHEMSGNKRSIEYIKINVYEPTPLVITSATGNCSGDVNIAWEG